MAELAQFIGPETGLGSSPADLNTGFAWVPQGDVPDWIKQVPGTSGAQFQLDNGLYVVTAELQLTAQIAAAADGLGHQWHFSTFLVYDVAFNPGGNF